MRNSFNQHLTNFQKWRDSEYSAPNLIDRKKQIKLKQFLTYLDSESFKNGSKFDLYHFQREAIERTVYSFEILGKQDLLLNIVTGGGKTVIIAGLIAYLRIIHDFNKFLILVPNTIVRQRLVDAFNPNSKIFVFDEFKFFFNSYDYLKDRFSLHIMEQGKDSSGIRTNNVILGNIHQIYEGKTNLAILMDKANVDQIAIFNDEAHNTKAKHYNLLLKKLEAKRLIRIDTTATPERLDGLHPDSEMILEYGIKQAMRDKIVKRIVVFKPDVDIVKLSWKDEEGKVYSVDEIPWAQIEKGWLQRNYDGKKVRIPAVKYVTDQKPATQLLSMALQCLEHQKIGVPADTDGQPKYKPLLFVVTFSINDAKQVAKILRGTFKKNVLVVHNEAPEADKEIAMQLNQDMKNVKYDAIVSVMMLREGWDVKNISVICLFRKFCYTQKGDKIISVYGPQVIGRGLRRIIVNQDRWESLYVVDHPILKHNWLWDQLDAAKYDGTLNPGDIIDEQKLPAEPPTDKIEQRTDEADKLTEKIDEETDWKKIAEQIPDFIEDKKVITNWQEFLDNCKYILEGVSIEEKINQIKSRNLDSGFTTLEKGEEIPNITVSDLKSAIHYSTEELQKMILKEMSNTATDALVEYDGNPDSRQTIIYNILDNHIKKIFLGGSETSQCNNKNLLELLWDTWPQIRENFLKPELIEGILTNK